MNERVPLQKEFGEIERYGGGVRIKKFGSNEIVGRAIYDFVREPTPHYSLGNLDVFRRVDQGKGFSSQLMTEIENISRETGIPMVLSDAIIPENNPMAMGMYANRKGWIEVQNKNDPDIRYYIFGEPSKANIQQLIDYFS